MDVVDTVKIQEEMERASTDMITATSQLQMEAGNVRADRPNWKTYLTSQMIPQDDYNFITAYEDSKGDIRKDMISKGQCPRTLINLMTNVNKIQTVRYVLTLIDDMLQEDKTRVEVFWAYARKQKQSVWAPFLIQLRREDAFVVNQTSRIITKLACWGPEQLTGSDLVTYFTFLKDQLKLAGNTYIQTSARCLQMMLRHDDYRIAFVNVDGISTIVSVLSGKCNFQLQYQLIFCIWCLTFNPMIAERMHRFGVVPVLADIFSESNKEKVTRVILSTFRNLLEKVEEREVMRDDALQMVQCRVLKTLSLMADKKYDDTDLTDDIEFLTQKLQENVQDLSSFDEYCTEIRSGRLMWSPVHKSEKFWRENAARFNEKNFELVKILVRLLESSTDPLVLAVAAHDIGEYVRHYPRGKNVIETLQGKTQVMKLLTHADPNVRYHALLAVQKLMVHNWEYLGKQLEEPKEPGKTAIKAK